VHDAASLSHMEESEEVIITPASCRMARAALNWGIREVAKRTGISQTTVNRFEKGLAKTNAATRATIQRVFERAGIEFLNGDEPGVKLKRRN
jgi:transcriptional regulator with XRE-family HTH domain